MCVCVCVCVCVCTIPDKPTMPLLSRFVELFSRTFRHGTLLETNISYMHM